MTTATDTTLGKFVARARVAWAEQNKQPDAISKKFYRRNDFLSEIMRTFIHFGIMSVVIGLIAYISAHMFLRFASPKDWLVYQIGWLYSLVCRQGYCSLPYLNAGLVVGAALLVLFTIYLSESFVNQFEPNDTEEVHQHLDLLSAQIREDYNGLAMLEKRIDAVEASIKEADSRVDVVLEYQPRSVADSLEASEEMEPLEDGDEPEPTAPAA